MTDIKHKIEIEKLTFSYPGSKAPALDDISFTVEPSEFVLVCGYSGSGKSTLLRHMKKELAPYGEKTGKVIVGGIEVSSMESRTSAREVGFVRQSPEDQIVTEKVWHELAFGLENLGLDNTEIRRRTAEISSYFGIQNWYRKPVADLSGGQKQLLNLAAVMVMQPSLLILDEPLSQLDPMAATEFTDTLYRINRDLGTTVVISEHRLDSLFHMADKVAVMDRGRLAAFGTPHWAAAKLIDEDLPMKSGLPEVARIFSSRGGSQQKTAGPIPLTVREGRLMLDEMVNAIDAQDASEPAEDMRELLQDRPKTDPLRVSDHQGHIPALEAKNIFFRYARKGEDILRGLDMAIEKGTVSCLLGGNGSGKSTLLRILAGLLKPQNGKVTRPGAAKDGRGYGIAMVPQSPRALFTEITVIEELYEVVRDRKEIPSTDKARLAHEMMQKMELSDLSEINPFDLSGGEQERLAIGKILLTDPDIMLLDEPTKGIDPVYKNKLGKILRDLAEEGRTVIMASHDMEFCAAYGDMAYLLFDGQIAASGTVKELFAGNSFYTTRTNRTVRKHRSDLVTVSEARMWIESLARASRDNSMEACDA